MILVHDALTDERETIQRAIDHSNYIKIYSTYGGKFQFLMMKESASLFLNTIYDRSC